MAGIVFRPLVPPVIGTHQEYAHYGRLPVIAEPMRKCVAP
jgi:hypothetical protein